MATVTFSAADDLLYAYLAGEIDHDAAQDLRIQLDDALLTRTPHTLVLDLGGVGFMDSSGVGLILDPAHPARPGTAAPCAAACGHSVRGRARPGRTGGMRMKAENTTKIQFDSLSVNEAYARGAAAAFLARYDPTVPQLADLKTAVSEAVTNCIVHAYPDRVGPIVMTLAVYPGRLVKITVADRGVGIPDIPKAMEPLFTTGNPEERSGLGFAVMQSFMDKVRVSSTPGHGTRVTLTKRLEEKPST